MQRGLGRPGSALSQRVGPRSPQTQVVLSVGGEETPRVTESLGQGPSVPGGAPTVVLRRGTGSPGPRLPEVVRRRRTRRDGGHSPTARRTPYVPAPTSRSRRPSSSKEGRGRRSLQLQHPNFAPTGHPRPDPRIPRSVHEVEGKGLGIKWP